MRVSRGVSDSDEPRLIFERESMWRTPRGDTYVAKKQDSSDDVEVARRVVRWRIAANPAKDLAEEPIDEVHFAEEEGAWTKLNRG
jgi:hypothetical protein